ncbi:unnamed protein product [Symbiodinium natans]|uniref:Uncharacterized protein n=1 Tax=Symbiodinium natans TaxID=878477 RepID=A0A812IFE7_9DINO|nr:unnamed protein product [Symbiodinium natans]
MTLGQVPVKVMCNVMDGFSLHMEDVDGVGVPKISMAISVKMSFPINDLLKMLALWQEREVDEEGRTRRAQEACKAAEVPGPLRNSPNYANYKAENSWEQISSSPFPKVVLRDEIKLRAKNFAALPVPEQGHMSYAQFRARRSQAGTAGTATSSLNTASEAPDSGQRPEVPNPKAPQGWTSPSWLAAVQHKASSAWESFTTQ